MRLRGAVGIVDDDEMRKQRGTALAITHDVLELALLVDAPRAPPVANRCSACGNDTDVDAVRNIMYGFFNNNKIIKFISRNS